MIPLSTLMVGLVFSYLGSIPPGMINISVLQLSMQNRKAAALSFTTAAVLVEFVYAALAVKFQMFLTANISITDYFRLTTAIVLIVLGVLNLRKHRNADKELSTQAGEKRNAFKKGALIGLANPLAIPFWLAVTAYLQSMNWITLDESGFWLYLVGISSGTFLLLVTIIVLATRYSIILNNHFLVYRLPGWVFISMGLWQFINGLKFATTTTFQVTFALRT